MADNFSVKDSAGASQTIYSSQESSVHKPGHLLVAGAKGGCAYFKSINLLATAVSVKGSAGNLYGGAAYNANAALRYFKLWNKTAATVTVGADTPDITVPLAANAWTRLDIPAQGAYFSTAISAAATTGLADNDSAAPSANDVIVYLFLG